MSLDRLRTKGCELVLGEHAEWNYMRHLGPVAIRGSDGCAAQARQARAPGVSRPSCPIARVGGALGIESDGAPEAERRNGPAIVVNTGLHDGPSACRGSCGGPVRFSLRPQISVAATGLSPWSRSYHQWISEVGSPQRGPARPDSPNGNHESVPVDPDSQQVDPHAGLGRPDRETAGTAGPVDVEDLPVVSIAVRVDLEGDSLAGLLLPDDSALTVERPGAQDALNGQHVPRPV